VAQAAIAYTSITPVPSTTVETYTLGMAAGERCEDLAITIFVAMEVWREARGSFVASELVAQFCCGWFEGTSIWFDTEGGGR
jgi:hypothetical protein